MSKPHAAILLLLANVFFIMPATAQDSGFYALASFSNADTEYWPESTVLVDGDDDAWQLGGGYAFSSGFSVEVSYHDFGIAFAGCPPVVFCLVAFPPEEVEIDGWSGQFVGSLPLARDLSLFAKAGLIGWEISAASPSLQDSGEDLIY
ncbi:MAG: hypothetical protein ACREQZ_06340, partial [Woeseiaceae bacterium]